MSMTPDAEPGFLVESQDMDVIYSSLEYCRDRLQPLTYARVKAVLDELCQVRTDGTKTPREE